MYDFRFYQTCMGQTQLVASLIMLEVLERTFDPFDLNIKRIDDFCSNKFLVNVVGLIFFQKTRHYHGGPYTHFHVSTHDHKP
jgi:hypothetical protein